MVRHNLQINRIKLIKKDKGYKEEEQEEMVKVRDLKIIRVKVETGRAV
jgi:hypothetical protein